MSLTFVLVSSLAMLLGADAAPTAAAKADLAKMQGTWTVVAAEEHGQKEAPDGKMMKAKLIIKDDTITVVQGSEGKNPHGDRGTLTLDPSTTPKSLTIKTVENGGTVVVHGIYQVEGETVMMCWSEAGAAPREFATKAGSDARLVVLRPTLAGVAGAARGDEGQKAAIKAELAKMQGTWNVVVAERDGHQAPAEAIKTMQLVCKDDTIIISEGEGAGHPHKERAKIELDVSTTPKSMVLKPGVDEKPCHGIYQLEGGTLKMCWTKEGGPAPKEFATKPDSDSVMFVLKRAEKE